MSSTAAAHHQTVDFTKAQLSGAVRVPIKGRPANDAFDATFARSG